MSMSPRPSPSMSPPMATAWPALSPFPRPTTTASACVRDHPPASPSAQSSSTPFLGVSVPSGWTTGSASSQSPSSNVQPSLSPSLECAPSRSSSSPLSRPQPPTAHRPKLKRMGRHTTSLSPPKTFIGEHRWYCPRHPIQQVRPRLLPRPDDPRRRLMISRSSSRSPA